MSNVEDAEDSLIGIPSPGILLAAKREEYGWSVKEVAGALRLSMKTVEAIEQDDYQQLPGKTYVMGYWHSYSQLLGISIDDSIQVHRAELSSDVREIALEPNHKQVRGSEEKSRKLFALLFACLLAAFLVAVWYWQDPDASIGDWVDAGLSSFNSPESVEVSSRTTVEPSSPEQVPPAADQSVLALPEPNFANDQETVDINTRGYEVLIRELPISRPDLTYRPWSESPLAAMEAAKAEAETEAETETETETTEVATSADTSEAAPDTAVQEQTASVAQAETTEQAQSAATQPQIRAQRSSPANTVIPDPVIHFQVDQESWIDVRDSAGERLIYRTVNSGENISLTGTPPYSVFLGSAEGVSVQYQGRPVSFGIHESGLFARFVVGN